MKTIVPASDEMSHGVFAPFATAEDDRLCFVLMPFRTDMDDIYSEVIRPVVTETPISLVCLRADELYGSRPIMQDIWRSIVSARLIIADLTHRNANVMYELGLSHAIEKSIIIVTQSMDDVPFDLRHMRCIVYDRGPAGVRRLKSELARTIQATLDESRDRSNSFLRLQRAQQIVAKMDLVIRERVATSGLRGRADQEPLERLLSNATDVFLCGPTLAIVAMRQELFKRRVNAGCQLRFLMPDPDPKMPAIQGLIGNWHTPPDGFLAESRSSLANLQTLRRAVSLEHVGKVGLRKLPFGLTLSCLMVDGETENGYIHVELLPVNTASPDRPHFVLRRTTDDHWYDFFKEKCNDLWQMGTDFEPQDYLT